MKKSVFLLSMLVMLGTPFTFGGDAIVLPLVVDEKKGESKEWRIFYQKLGDLESGGEYTRVNTYGYLGKYQFSIHTLEMIGIKVSKQEYLGDSAMQERSVRLLTQHNERLLKRYIRRYKKIQVGEVVVSKAGILAAAHLVGAGNVIAYLTSKGQIDKADAYKTRCSDYMRLFSEIAI